MKQIKQKKTHKMTGNLCRENLKTFSFPYTQYFQTTFKNKIIMKIRNSDLLKKKVTKIKHSNEFVAILKN